MTTSLIISTYNNVPFLRLSLNSLLEQSVFPDEVLIADDGSTHETKDFIEQFKKNCPIRLIHVWQEDKGFRLSKIRNEAIKVSCCEYLIFIDGDIVMHDRFIEDHKRLARRGYYVTGSRVFISEKATNEMAESSMPKKIFFWDDSIVFGRINALYLPQLTNVTVNIHKGRRLYGRGANMAMWKKDIELINGFNQDIVGYGDEDSEAFNRLNNNQIIRRYAKFQAIAYHLHHEPKVNNQDREILRINDDSILVCKNGLRQL